MSLPQEALRELLNPLAAGGAWPTRPNEAPVYPLIIFQLVGGRAFWHFEKRLPSHRHYRVQVTVWSPREAEAMRIMHAAEKALCESALPAEPYGAAVAMDANLDPKKLYGFRQDFGVWFPDS
jgi:Protein of unknown function (DUF3168).